MTKRQDVVHPLLEKLWQKAMRDKDTSFKPYAVRIDVEGIQCLRSEQGPWKDGSMDPYQADGIKAWRKLPFIMEYRREAGFDPRIEEDAILMVPLTLCIEARQDGEEGRRKYYDATPEELAAIRAHFEGAKV